MLAGMHAWIMHKFVILAVRDISKSEFTENASLKTGAQRNITTDTNNENDNSTNYFNRNTVSSKCLKFILKQINPPSEDLITAFEFDGSVVPSSKIPLNSLCGSVIEISDSPLDFCRGILLLHSQKCKIRTDVANSPNEFIDDQLDDDIIESLFDEMEDI